MSYSRRNFLKAAGSGVVLTAVAGESLMAAPRAAPGVAAPFAPEKAAFLQAISVALTGAAPLKYSTTKIDMAKGLLASGLARLNV